MGKTGTGRELALLSRCSPGMKSGGNRCQMSPMDESPERKGFGEETGEVWGSQKQLPKASGLGRIC